MQQPKFQNGASVSLKGQNARGTIQDHRFRENRFEYKINYGGNGVSWEAEDVLEIDGIQLRWEDERAFLRDLCLIKLDSRLSDSFYSHRASRTEFQVHQFKPILKFLRNPDQRILIADEVGLGKTIEAALIYLELKARADIKRVMIVCPSRLRQKWQNEFLNRFDEQFKIYGTREIEELFQDYDRIGDNKEFRAIVSYETLRQRRFIDGLDERQVHLDLLIMDEAHKMRNQTTKTYAVGDVLTTSSDAVVFLTATPINLDDRDLFNLLHLLSPKDFETYEEFKDKIKDINSTKNDMEPEERIENQKRARDLSPFAPILVRTRKREVMGAAVRKAQSVNITLSPREKEVYDVILNSAYDVYQSQNIANIAFITVLRERLAASCLPVARKKLLSSQGSEEEFFGIEENIDLGEDEDETTTASPQVHLEVLRSLPIGEEDTKLTKLLEIIEGVLADTPESKILIFSTFRGTLEYLYEHLQKYYPSVIHGQIAIGERYRRIENFKNKSELKIMLSSEVGSEGLDFQFCDVLINYDLPWNPMQVEQRIGRLDRFGQKSESIRIFNFFIEDTIEGRIFERLYNRIQIFEGAIGSLETILGPTIKELTKEIYKRRLTVEEEKRLAEEKTEALIRQRQMSEELEEQKDELMGHDELFAQEVHERIETGRTISPLEVKELVLSFVQDLRDSDNSKAQIVLRSKSSGLLTVDEILMRKLHSEKRSQPTLVLSERLENLNPNPKRIEITFESEYTREQPNIELVTHQHILAQAALRHWRNKKMQGLPATWVSVPNENADEIGLGYFFIYRFEEISLRTSYSLHTLILMDDGRWAESTANRLLYHLQSNESYSEEFGGDFSYEEAEKRADDKISEVQNKKRQEARERFEEIINARIRAIKQNADAKIRSVDEQLRKVSDEKIRRMRLKQIENIKAHRDSKVEELRNKSKPTLRYKLMCVGRIEIY